MAADRFQSQTSVSDEPVLDQGQGDTPPRRPNRAIGGRARVALLVGCGAFALALLLLLVGLMRSHRGLCKEVTSLRRAQVEGLENLARSQAGNRRSISADFQAHAASLSERFGAMEKVQAEMFQRISTEMAGRLDEVTRGVRDELAKTAGELQQQAGALGAQFTDLRTAQEVVLAELRTDMTSKMERLTTDLRSEFGKMSVAVTDQANALGAQLADLRTAQEAVLTQTRAEMATKVDGLLTEMRTEFGKAAAAMAAQTAALGGQVETLRKTQEDLFPQVRAEMSRKVDDVLSQVAQELLKTGRDQTMATATAIQDQASDSLQRLVAAAEETYGIVEGKLVQDEERSRQSRAAGAAAATAGDYEMARIYYVNAFNHSPSDPAALADLCNLVSERYSQDATALEQTAAVVDVALYQLPADAVPQALQNRQAIMELQESLVARNAPPPFDPQAEFSAIRQTPLAQIGEDSTKLRLHIQQLNELVQACSDVSGDAAGAVAAQAQAEAVTASNLLTIAEVLKQTDRYLGLVEKHPVQDEQSARRASNVLMAASSAFSVVWQLDLAELPQTVQNRIRTTEGRLNDAAGTVSRAVSERQADRVSTLLARIKCPEAVDASPGNRVWQKRIEAAESDYRRATEESTRVTDEATRETLPNRFLTAGKEIAKMRRGQYLEYQAMAVQMLRRLHLYWTKDKFTTNAEAKDLFNKSDITSLDLSLVTPEVSRAYERVLQPYMNAGNAQMAFDLTVELMTHKKWTLEDF
jgi:tetratricopeptide (TPR) repeat protein